MRMGFHTTNIPEELSPDRIAQEVSGRGYESLWCGEHSHIPVSNQPVYRGGQKMPELYKKMMNPFLSLLMAATAANDLLIGTSVALPLEHDIFDMAKTVSTLDHYSNGRFLFGVGVGWNKEELANHSSVPWPRRYHALAECVRALRCLWTDDEPEFHGQYYDFDPVWAFPKPLQKPRLPVLCGAGGHLGVQQAADWADGWVPMDRTLGDVAAGIAKFRQAAYDAGRDAESIPISIIAIGDPTVKTLAGYRDLGVSRVIVGAGRSGWDDPAATLPFLDRYAPAVDEFSAGEGA
jgi:probable F420-dependent oxidoreductase